MHTRASGIVVGCIGLKTKNSVLLRPLPISHLQLGGSAPVEEVLGLVRAWIHNCEAITLSSGSPA